ncbi:MAG: hypothetical protein ACRDOI_19435 [Trebonia sp.]
MIMKDLQRISGKYFMIMAAQPGGPRSALPGSGKPRKEGKAL